MHLIQFDLVLLEVLSKVATERLKRTNLNFASKDISEASQTKCHELLDFSIGILLPLLSLGLARGFTHMRR